MKYYYIQRYVALIVIIATLSSCKGLFDDMLDVEPTASQYSKNDVFSTEPTATAAITGIYGNMYSSNETFAGGGAGCVAVLTAMSGADVDYYADVFDHMAFAQYNLLPENNYVTLLWKSLYKTIYAANSALAGLQESASLSKQAKERLTGEAHFVRAFTYFYLVNLFGDVPLVTGLDYKENAVTPRAKIESVYTQIINDLTQAITLLPDNYASPGRVRPNQSAATALLARVHLYRSEWVAAEQRATAVLNNPRYSLPTLETVFLNTSQEAIWQIMPLGWYENTREANIFILRYPPIYYPQSFALTQSLRDEFEQGDLRYTNWINSYTEDNITYYYAFKYKIREGGTNTTPAIPLSEYSMVLRLAEQYLIRAEARAQQGNLDGAIEDINAIRERADIPLLDPDDPAMTKDHVLDIILQERRKELFTEWGHRWLDLKRTGKATQELGSRPNWKDHAVLYPIPKVEMDKNPAIQRQNDGY